VQENTYTVQNASKPFSPNSHLVGWCSKDSCRGTVFIQFLNWLQIRLISSEHLPIVFHWWATSSYPTRLCNWMKIELLHLHSSLNVSPATFLRERKRAEKKKNRKKIDGCFMLMRRWYGKGRPDPVQKSAWGVWHSNFSRPVTESLAIPKFELFRDSDRKRETEREIFFVTQL